jgi:hypothetical protein
MTGLTFYLDNNINKAITISVSTFVLDYLQSKESRRFSMPMKRRINFFISRKYGTCDNFTQEIWDEIYSKYDVYKEQFVFNIKNY